jgi:aminoglycoside phosphotransferase (APT) family kinase protein
MAMELLSPALLDTRVVGERLGPWLEAQTSGELTAVSEIVRPGGAGGSAENLLVTTLGPDGRTEALAVRLAPSTYRVIFESDLATQFRVLQALRDTTVPAPVPMWLEDDETIAGAPFMVTSRIRGQAPSDFPTYQEAGFVYDADPSDRNILWTGAVSVMGSAATVPVEPLAFLDRPDRGRTGIEQMISYLEEAARWAFDGSVPDLALDVLDTLRRTIPQQAPDGFSWGDARMANLLFDGTVCTGALDWESASLAGPMVDLGWWCLFDRLHREDFGISRLEGLGDRSQTVALWEQISGFQAVSLDWFEALAGFALVLRRQRSAALRQKVLGVTVSADDPRSADRLLVKTARLLETAA